MTDPMTQYRHVTMTEARRSWNRLIAEIVDTGTPVLLTRYGKPIAVLEPYDSGQRQHTGDQW